MDVLSGVVESMRSGPNQFFRRRFGPGWGNRFGPYPGAALHLVLAGSCWFVRDGKPPLHLRQGDVLLLPHGSQHGLADRPDVRVTRLPPDSGPEDRDVDGTELRVDLLCGVFENGRCLVHPMLRSLPDVIYVLTGPGHRELSTAVELLTTEIIGDRPGSEASRMALLELVLLYLLRAWVGDQSTRHETDGWPAALADPVLAPALNRVHDDLARSWTIDDLAEVAGMSRKAFTRRFSRVIGRSPAAYVTWLRLSRAAHLLSTTDDSLARIAHGVGYKSQSAFAHAFRRELGVYPGRFRTDARTRTS